MLNSADEQQMVRDQIVEENQALKVDMEESEKKIFGKKGKPSDSDVEKMSAKQKKAHFAKVKKVEALANKKYEARQKKLKKTRLQDMAKMSKAFKKKKK